MREVLKVVRGCILHENLLITLIRKRLNDIFALNFSALSIYHLLGKLKAQFLPVKIKSGETVTMWQVSHDVEIYFKCCDVPQNLWTNYLHTTLNI